jgi:trigger factor
MKTTINQISPVEYELEITAEASDLDPEIKDAIRQQRAQTQLKGFRPGKVPLNLVKKMHGKALAYGVAEQKVQEVYRKEILTPDEYDVIGQPKLTELDYELDSDLHAVIRFGVRPEVELKDLSGEQLTRLEREISDEDIDEQVERIRLDHADLVPVEDEAIEEDFQVIVDLQRVDESSNSPIIGEKEEDVTFYMDDERLNTELREGLLGKKSGDSFFVDLPHGDGAHVHTHRYKVTIKDTKRREMPELDDAFVGEVSKDQLVSVDELREDLRKNLEGAWKQRSQELLDGHIVERMLELHDIAVPQSAVELFLDSFVEDVKRRNDGKLPENFDAAAFREANRGEAERQAKWMLIRDTFIEREGLDVSDADLDEYFETAAAQNEQLSPAILRQYYESMKMLEQVEQQILSRKAFAALADKFEIIGTDVDAFEEEMKARQERESVEGQSGGTTLVQAR